MTLNWTGEIGSILRQDCGGYEVAAGDGLERYLEGHLRF
jgi:hypothetical protein